MKTTPSQRQSHGTRTRTRTFESVYSAVKLRSGVKQIIQSTGQINGIYQFLLWLTMASYLLKNWFDKQNQCVHIVPQSLIKLWTISRNIDLSEYSVITLNVCQTFEDCLSSLTYCLHGACVILITLLGSRDIDHLSFKLAFDNW